jgi:hypothetical protein
VGTNNSNGLSEHQPILPVVEPVNGQVWSALAEIGRQLQILASAHLGQGCFAPSSGLASAYTPDSPTVVELVNQFLLAKARAGKSDRYLRALRNSLSKFMAGRAQMFAHEISVADVEKWMQRPEWQPRTQRGYLADVRTLYNFGIRRGLLKTNPANGVELPVICRALAIRYFAGLRSSEADKLEENKINGMIEVTA